jgi:hypothetical protein
LAPASLMAVAMVAFVAMASMDTSAPFRPSAWAGRSMRTGIAAVSLLLASTASWPGTRHCVVAKAETRCKVSRPTARSWVRREVLPSIATISGRSGQFSRTQAVKSAENRAGLIRLIRLSASVRMGRHAHRANNAAGTAAAPCPIPQGARSRHSPPWFHRRSATRSPPADAPPAARRAGPRSWRSGPEAPEGATSRQYDKRKAHGGGSQNQPATSENHHNGNPGTAVDLNSESWMLVLRVVERAELRHCLAGRTTRVAGQPALWHRWLSLAGHD